jgi:hypothetical protein
MPSSERGAGRFDVSVWKELFHDERVWSAHAVVVAGEGGPHWELSGNDVLVECMIVPGNAPCTARLGGWLHAIPPIGTEVVLEIPHGEFAAGPVISRVVGLRPDGLNASTAVLLVPAGATLLVHDGTAADALPLATKADLDALQHAVDTHVHPTTGGPSGTPVAPMPQAAGTSVLKAK